ncbi:tRNA N6-adenosine(37)-N6-threonylcarbamoyltransferase complex dimerization subunit TsaB [Polynucleobacter wuianus]|uniref:tRNA N6-adenosine(37)-N6-threonylcarbamoyltransferase complex dimerization subunit TsaB n=1 Tax=Polynucleobacter wuianus TaxID=1743168 RepID=A0A191UEV2_9BURK|nr:MULTISPECIES: tRNA (adenosine(37)-N6)-threonylcarbamoyltransferase complex dimerization subunit type 1 TsaB [Polynucleobacter]ANI99578.1 tRNA N6-adenosine(37)-N6-threonylcarbamoyltransferase complex dimerization subunit TsaB [Polynucleobacter wuianus]MBU3551787.1 tRNA (adenosine(37)-N6)-threonylcarbamoyltransferase complex dimerization subunit type 1 TsaB [Polynucleobacter sp. MWH-Post4-6-1]MBU3610756.1 tRNA (adenosine(37)-N6)-threonylcarbamoyltransferase complex dimerization subunit type 1 T
MTQLLAIDTSSAWCSVALSLGDKAPEIRHELVSAGASQLLLPWVEDLLAQSNKKLSDLNAIAIGIGPGAFTGVRLGVAVVQGLAIASNMPVLPVASLDAIASQVVKTSGFTKINPSYFVVAVDARMDEIYWAKYETKSPKLLPVRVGDIHLSKPEDIDLTGIQYLAGSAIKAYAKRLFSQYSLPDDALDADMNITALGILDCAKQMWVNGQQINVAYLQPLYIRNKVALTTDEREIAFKRV